MCFFLFTHTSTTAIYTLSLHDALPISSLLKWIRSSLFKEKIKRKWVEFLQLWFFSTVTITVFICVIYFMPEFGPPFSIPTVAFIGIGIILYFLSRDRKSVV